jgi:hypothetical protein
MFVNGVVENLKHAVVQSSFVCWPNVHSRPLTHAGKSFELVDFRGVVELFGRDGKGGVSGFGHKRTGSGYLRKLG